RYGVSGTVVSRKQLTVNFARNAIMENECEVWKLIKAVLRARGRELVDKKPILNDGERLNVIERILSGEYGRDT
ncbi:hypothetical protein, partial [Klebsiella pneumoniae]|uniref:hypothetical protein n=1 Tax=Klebsiella pneumoniae TaxID=573 RepID=UPI003EE0D304